MAAATNGMAAATRASATGRAAAESAGRAAEAAIPAVGTPLSAVVSSVVVDAIRSGRATAPAVADPALGAWRPAVTKSLMTSRAAVRHADDETRAVADALSGTGATEGSGETAAARVPIRWASTSATGPTGPTGPTSETAPTASGTSVARVDCRVAACTGTARECLAGGGACVARTVAVASTRPGAAGAVAGCTPTRRAARCAPTATAAAPEGLRARVV
jgi:hypothetical protein